MKTGRRGKNQKQVYTHIQDHKTNKLCTSHVRIKWAKAFLFCESVASLIEPKYSHIPTYNLKIIINLIFAKAYKNVILETFILGTDNFTTKINIIRSKQNWQLCNKHMLFLKKYLWICDAQSKNMYTKHFANLLRLHLNCASVNAYNQIFSQKKIYRVAITGDAATHLPFLCCCFYYEWKNEHR